MKHRAEISDLFPIYFQFIFPFCFSVYFVSQLQAFVYHLHAVRVHYRYHAFRCSD